MTNLFFKLILKLFLGFTVLIRPVIHKAGLNQINCMDHGGTGNIMI